MLNVGLDARGTEPGFKSHFGRGLGRYAEELLKVIVPLAEQSSKGIKIKPLYSSDLNASEYEKKIIEKLPCGKQTVETQVFLPGRIKKLGLDLIHFIAHVDATARCKVPYLVGVADLIPLKFAQMYKADKLTWGFYLARYLEKQSIHQARGIIAISEATKRDLVEILNINPDKVFVTPLGVGEEFKARDPNNWKEKAKEIKRKHQIEEERPIIFYAGGIDARKNIHFMLEVLDRIIYQSAIILKPILVMVGKYEGDRNYPKLLERIQALGLEKDVRLLGFLSMAEMIEVYQAADLKVFPSIYEGFGLPVLEAMACGLPVVAGNNSSIPEVAGDAAILLNDNDQKQWVTEIVTLLQNANKLRELGEKGIKQAQKFSWTKTANATLEAYQYFIKK